MSSSKSGSRSPYSRPRHPDRLSGSKRSEPDRFSRPEIRARSEKSNHDDNVCMRKLSESGSRSPYSRSRHRERSPSLKRSEPERSSGPEIRPMLKNNHDHEDNESEVCMRKLSEFNESLWRQERPTYTKFQWNHLFPDNHGKETATAVPVAAVTKPEATMLNDRTTSTHPMSSTGIGLTVENHRFIGSIPLHSKEVKSSSIDRGEEFRFSTGMDLTEENHLFIGSRPLHLKEVKSSSIDRGEEFRFPAVGSEGMMGEAVGFGERLGFDFSSSDISQMAMNRIRKTEEITELAYRKMERNRAIGSIVDKIDGSGESGALELDRRTSLPQQYTTEQKSELLHGGMHQQREDCSRDGLAPSYVGFSGGAESVVGVEMNHRRSPNVAIFHGERRRLPPLYPEVNENPDGNGGQIQNGEVFHGERQQFQLHVHFGREPHGEIQQNNEGFDSRMNCHHIPKRVPFHGEKQEFSEEYGHTLPQTCIGSGRESNLMEQRNDVFSSRMNHPWGQKLHLSVGERPPEARSLHQQLYIDLNVKPDETRQENLLFGSRMSHHETPSHGEKQNMQEDSSQPLPHRHFGSNGESRVEQVTDVLGSRMCYPQDQREACALGESQQVQQDSTRHISSEQKMQEDLSQSLSRHHFALNEKSHVMEQYPEVLGLRMCYPQDQRESNAHGENQHLLQDSTLHISAKQKMEEDFSQSLPHHNFGLNGESQVMEQGTKVLGSGMCYPQDQREAYVHDESQNLQQDSTQHISAKEEGGINGQSLNEHSTKRIIDLRKIRESQISTLFQTSEASNDEILYTRYGGQQWSDENSCLPSNITDRDYHEPSSPRMQEFVPPTKRKSIKQRLGQPCSASHLNPSHRKSVKHRLGLPSQFHYNTRSIKQRLGPPYDVHNRIDVPRFERHNLGKPMKENDGEFDKGVQARDVSHPVKHQRDEPPEDSDEFKQLIDDTYLKFVKVLYENPAHRRKYTDRGAETLKCCECGSKSEDFVNTLSLVKHAFTSGRRRVEHLGLHKALCLLKGWDSMAESNGVWVPKSLPNAEVLAMKEDLVVWPPVVIVHNSSIGTTKSNDRIVVSIEDLQAFLTDTGFDKGILKVCRGKPANQSIMVVIFSGTFSGLIEAERLHNFYAENKHGRDEFQQINDNSGETWRAPLHKAKHILYGYLGTAEDLDKLNFETKSHSVIRSKKKMKIYDSADARLDTERETRDLIQNRDTE